MSWFVNGILGMVCFACMVLTWKYLMEKVPTLIILFYMFLFATFGYGIWSVAAKENLVRSGPVLGVIVIAAVFAVLGNYFDVMAIKLAPNAGYASALKSGQIILIAIFSLFLFSGQSLTASGVIGLTLIISGIVVLGVFNQN